MRSNPSLYDALFDRLQGKEYSNYFSCWCPFHEKKHHSHIESMMVFDDGFRCLSCGKSGSLEYLWKIVNHGRTSQDFERRKSHAVLPRWRKWENKFGELPDIAIHAHKALRQFKQFQWYFKERKIEKFIDEGMFGYLDGWAVFPVRDQEKAIVDIVVRATKGKGDTRYVLSPNNDRADPFLYVPHWSRVIQCQTCYVVFGMLDAWALSSIYLPVVTGTTGQSLSVNRLKELDKQFIIVPDRGEENAAYKLANQLGWRGDVKMLEYPFHTKDPDDIRRKFGDVKLKELIGG